MDIKGRANVIVTFLNESEISERRSFYMARLLNRKPVKIIPYKVKDLIEEGRR